MPSRVLSRVSNWPSSQVVIFSLAGGLTNPVPNPAEGEHRQRRRDGVLGDQSDTGDDPHDHHQCG